jgi:hypothetical protein
MKITKQTIVGIMFYGSIYLLIRCGYVADNVLRGHLFRQRSHFCRTRSYNGFISSKVQRACLDRKENEPSHVTKSAMSSSYK